MTRVITLGPTTTETRTTLSIDFDSDAVACAGVTAGEPMANNGLNDHFKASELGFGSAERGVTSRSCRLNRSREIGF